MVQQGVSIPWHWWLTQELVLLMVGRLAGLTSFFGVESAVVNGGLGHVDATTCEQL